MEHFVYYMRWAGVSIISIIGIWTLLYGWSIHSETAIHQIYVQLIVLTGVVIIGVAMICDALLRIEGKIWKYLGENHIKSAEETKEELPVEV